MRLCCYSNKLLLLFQKPSLSLSCVWRSLDSFLKHGVFMFWYAHFLLCNWAIIAMKHRCAKSTNSGFNMAAVCIFNMLDMTLFNLNFKCQCCNKRIAGDFYHWSDLVYLKPLTMLTRARNHFSRLDLHSAVCSLFVLFFFSTFSLPPHTPLSSTSRNAFFQSRLCAPDR